MAVEQSGTKAVPDPDQPAQPAQPAAAEPAVAGKPAAQPAAEQPDGPQPDDAPQPDAKSDLEELKRKFREALDRKHSAHATAQGADDTGKVHGSHGPAVSRRSFRRKSGG
jgi:hypothetical protein